MTRVLEATSLPTDLQLAPRWSFFVCHSDMIILITFFVSVLPAVQRASDDLLRAEGALRCGAGLGED